MVYVRIFQIFSTFLTELDFKNEINFIHAQWEHFKFKKCRSIFKNIFNFDEIFRILYVFSMCLFFNWNQCMQAAKRLSPKLQTTPMRFITF